LLVHQVIPLFGDPAETMEESPDDAIAEREGDVDEMLDYFGTRYCQYSCT